MAVIRDVMPAFQLFQPNSIADAQKLLEQHGQDAWVMAGGLDSFDWLKDRIKKTQSLGRSERNRRTQGGSHDRRRNRDRRHDHAHRSGAPSHHPAKVWTVGAGCGARGLAPDSQSGNARRQRVARRALLVLSRRLAVLPRRGQHLLRRHPGRPEPRARDSARGALCSGQSL